MNFNEWVQRFCIEKLARILYDCVACSSSDRSLLDWLTAERFVLANQDRVDLIVALFGTRRTKLEGDRNEFAEFDWFCGRAVWGCFYQALRKELRVSSGEAPHYTHIRSV